VNSAAALNASSLVVPVTIPATDNLLVVAVAYYNRSVSASAVTVNGTPLARIRRDSNPSYQATTEFWHVVNPPVGAVNVQITMTGATGTGIPLQAAAVSYSGVDAGLPVEAQAASIVGGTHTSHLDSVTTLTPGAVVLDVLTTGAATAPTPDAGQAAAVNRMDSGSTFSVSERGPVSPAGVANMRFTFPSTVAASAHSVIALRPAAQP
jgi:hypothetical protein